MKWRQKYYFSSFIISNSKIEILVSFLRSTNVNVNMSFPNSNFEGNFSTYVFGKSFWHYRDQKFEFWASRHILCKKTCVMQVNLTLSRPEKWILDIAIYIMQKKLNFFICVQVRILCKKVKYVWSSHFPEAITTNMQVGYDSFVFE